jgi:hypothetical protein
MTGVKRGFAQASHGKKNYIAKPAKGDWILYYSAKDTFENSKPLQKFTATGKITDDEPFQVKAGGAYRRRVNYIRIREASIRPLVEQLSFIKNKKRWGFYLISGFREIPEQDFRLVKKAMKKMTDNSPFIKILYEAAIPFQY